MRLTLTLIISLLTSCATLAPLSDIDKIQLTEAALKHAIDDGSKYFECNVENIFIGADDIEIDPSFISRFSYDGIIVLPISESTQSCETGIVQKDTKARGYAFSVFEINDQSSNKAEVKWGYWYSCTKHTYKYTTFVKVRSGWQYVSTRK